MLKEAIEFITELTNGELVEAHGKTYYTQNLEEVPGPNPQVKPLTVHSLSGLADYIVGSKEHLRDEIKSLVHVVNPREVMFVSALFGEWEQRHNYVRAEPFIGKDFTFDRYLDVETFIVGLQTGFVQDEQTASILRLVGNLQASDVKTVMDDGVSQEVTVRQGVAKLGNEIVNSPVDLRPYRTFQDVEQPQSRYVLRMRRNNSEGLPMIALFEVDDKLWKLQAVRDIKKYLDDHEGLAKTLVLA